MTGQRGADGEQRRFAVADLSKHDDVGVLAQDGTQRRGETQPAALVDLHLSDAGNVVFHGILHGHGVELGEVQPLQHGVQRRGLAAAGGTGVEDDAVGDLQQILDPRQLRALASQPFEPAQRPLAVEKAQDRFLAADGGKRGNAEIDFAPVDVP